MCKQRSNRMNLEKLNFGYVLERFVSPRGSHSKWKIVNPRLYFNCDGCGGKLGDKATRLERSGNKILATLCLSCYKDDIKRGACSPLNPRQ